MTTISELAKRSAKIAYVLEIEGIEYCFTDCDPTGIGAAGWTSAGYTVKGGLNRPGSTKQQIDILQFKIEPTSLGFELVDVDGTLGTLFADSISTMKKTYLTAALSRTASSMTVKNADAFSASGTLYVGHERMTYSGKTSTTFTGLTRGTLPWGGKDEWAHSFSEDDTGIGAEVTTVPTAWKGRGIMLRIVAKDAESGEWNTRTNSYLVYAGTLTDSWQYVRGVYTLSADSVEAKLTGKLFYDQYSAELSAIQLPNKDTLTLHEFDYDATGHIQATKTSIIEVPAGSYTLSSLVETINGLFDAARGYAGTPIENHWSLEIVTSDDKSARIRWTCQFDSGEAADQRTQFWITWGSEGGGYRMTNNQYTVKKILGVESNYYSSMWGDNNNDNNNEYKAVTDFTGSPSIAWIDGYTKTLTVDTGSEIGTWHDQLPTDMPKSLWNDGARGYILVGGNSVWAVSYSSGVFTKYAEWNWKLTDQNNPDQASVSNALDIGHMIPSINPEGWNSKGIQAIKEIFSSDKQIIEIKQVWIASGSVASLVLKLMHSTGSTGYNGSRWDLWPASLGAAIPSKLIDYGSLGSVSAASGASAIQRLVLFKESDLATEIQSLLGSIGAHLVWSNGKLRAILPTTLEDLETDYEIDAYSVGMDDVVCDNATDLIRNTCSLKYNRNPTNDDYLSRPITYVDKASVDIYGPQGEIEFEARGIYDSGDGSMTRAWLSHVAAPLCAYWSRSMRRYSISGAPGLWGISPGDIVEFTCDDPPDPTTGTYGLDGVRGWVIAVSYNHDEQFYENITMVVPTVKAYKMGPSAKLNFNATNAGYVEDESPSNGYFTLWTELHEFSLNTETIDAKNFMVGDLIIVCEADPHYTDYVSILSWDPDEILAINDDGSIECLGVPPAEETDVLRFFDTSKEYYILLAKWSDQTTTNRHIDEDGYCAFIADDDDDLIEGTDPATFYGSFKAGAIDEEGTDPDASTGVYRPCYYHQTEGYTFSTQFARDLAQSANALWQYGQLQQVFGLGRAGIEPYPYESGGGSFDENTVALPSCPIRIPWGVSSLTVGVGFSYAGSTPPAVPEEYLSCRVTISPVPGPDSEGTWQGEYSQGSFNVYASDGVQTWSAELDGIRSVNGWAWITLEAHCYSESLWFIHSLYAYANPRELNS